MSEPTSQPDSARRLSPRALLSRSELVAVAGTVVAGAVLGLAAALAWWALAPRLPLRIAHEGALFVEEQPEEFVASDARFGLLLAIVGVVIGGRLPGSCYADGEDRSWW